MSSPPAFRYRPLDEDDHSAFRLLTILPGAFSAQIQCNLAHISSKKRFSPSVKELRRIFNLSIRQKAELVESPTAEERDPATHYPSYEALSYAWGDEDHNLPIIIDGHVFNVSPTLDCALRHLRLPDKPRRMWIDAICIDQDNAKDKAGQIRYMRDIYSNADRVIAWLGESSSDSDLAIEFAERLSSLVLKREGINIDYWSKQVVGPVEHLLTLSNISSWSALHRLLDRSWWLRAWIVQEVVVAKSVLFLCGTTSISWNKLGQAVIVVLGTYHRHRFLRFQRTPAPPMQDYYISFIGSSQSAKNLVVDREQGRVNKQFYGKSYLRPAAQWIAGGRLRDCQFAHDKIFSILGLTSETFRKSIDIDYTQPIEDMYKLVVKACIEDSNCLNVLSHSQHFAQNPQLPSFVPHWGLQHRHRMLFNTEHRGPQMPYAIFSNDLSELTVKGITLETVIETQVEFQLIPGTSKAYSPIDTRPNSKIIRATANDRCFWEVDHQALRELFIPATSRWNLVTFNGGYDTLLNLFLKMLWMKRHPTSYDPDWYTKTRLPPRDKELFPPHKNDFPNLQTFLQDFLLSRTVFETDKYFGIASDTAEPGDVVCLISGCSFPVLLRPTGNGKYHFLGDVFLPSDRLGYDRMFDERDDHLTRDLREITLV